MKYLINYSFRLLSLLVLVVGTLSASAQDSPQLQIISPFDSLFVSAVKAVGNLMTGSVDVTMQVTNQYHKLAVVEFSGGAFGDFGVTDDKGVKYKLYSNDHLIGTGGINKGYAPITGLQLGKSKTQMILLVQDTLSNGQISTLHFRLMKVDKSVVALKEMHLLSMLFLDYMMKGQKQFLLKNVPVEWIKPKGNVKAETKTN